MTPKSLTVLGLAVLARSGHRDCIGRRDLSMETGPGWVRLVAPMRREDCVMLDGVAVDELTDHFLRVATDSGGSDELSRTLRDFFHDASNRLNSLKIGLHVARRAAEPGQAHVWDELDLSYRGLEVLIERLQTICRPLGLAPVCGDLGHWLDERRALWTCRFAERGGRIEWAPPRVPAIGWFDPMRIVQGLDALVTWRAGDRERGEPARLSWGADGSHFHLEWSEQGPRVDEPLESREGRSVSMTLPLLARIITAHAGSMTVSKRGGLVIRLAWPLDRADAAGV
jgi:hypothetical protein